MIAPINPPDLDLTLKTLWGASQLPFGAAVPTPYASQTFKETRRRLEQLVAVHACGLLHGPNGVGKTLLWPQNSVGFGCEQWFLKQAAKGMGKRGRCDELEDFARNSVGPLLSCLHFRAHGLDVNLRKALF